MRKDYIWDHSFASRLYKKYCDKNFNLGRNPIFSDVEEVLFYMYYIFKHIRDEIEAGNNVRILGFGSFTIQNRKARVGRNPKTGEKIKIPSKSYVSFKSGELLKRSVNASGGNKKHNIGQWVIDKTIPAAVIGEIKR